MDPVIVEVYSDAARELIERNIKSSKRSSYVCVIL